MKQNIRWLTLLAAGWFTTTVSATSIVDFLKYGGITYVKNNTRVGRELGAQDLGREITKVKFKFVWDGLRPGVQPQYGPDEAYAASLAPMQKLIPIYPRKKCVIPLGQSRVREIVQPAHLLVGDFNVGGVLLVTQGALNL